MWVDAAYIGLCMTEISSDSVSQCEVRKQCLVRYDSILQNVPQNALIY